MVTSMLIDTVQERIWQAQLDRLRAELAVPACSGDCRNCPLNTTVINQTDGEPNTTTAAKH